MQILTETDVVSAFNQKTLTLTKVGDKVELTVDAVKNHFPEIELTEHEIAWAYLNAYKEKAVVMFKEERERDRLAKIEKIKSMWDYDTCYKHAYETGVNIGIQRNFEFVLDDDNRGVFDLLALYFSNDPAFEEEEFYGEKMSLKKGICLLSPVRGNGKTTLLDCFMYNKRGCFLKMSTKKMANDFQLYGLKDVQDRMWLVECSNHAGNFYQSVKGFHYDDFGDEDAVKHMGSPLYTSSAIINNIYDNHRDENQFHRFHLSMNYKWSEYEQKYGSNTASRISEMFNLVKVPGNSRR